MALNSTDIRRLAALNAEVAFTCCAETYAEDDRTGRIRKVSEGHVVAFIIDKSDSRNRRTVNKFLVGYEAYAQGRGRSESEALANALDIAERTAKPLTLAQQADLEAGRFVDPAARARIAELEAQLAAVSGSKGDAKGKIAKGVKSE